MFLIVLHLYLLHSTLNELYRAVTYVFKSVNVVTFMYCTMGNKNIQTLNIPNVYEC